LDPGNQKIMALTLRPGVAEELKMTLEDVEWFQHFAHPEKWGDDCVMWDGAFWHEYGGSSENHRHGMFLWGPDDDVQMMPAHRLAYLLYRGDFGDLLALHKCPGRTNKNKGRCVNPWHITPGTPRENLIDRWNDKDLDVMACFHDRRVLSIQERKRKYNVSEHILRSIDTGKCPLTTHLVKVVDL